VPGSNPGSPAVYPKGYVQKSIYREKDKKQNNMKKLSILVASVLGISALAAVPANAAPMTVAVTTFAGGAYGAPTESGTATTSAIVRTVPADNSVDDADVVKFVATVDAGSVVTVSATNASLITATATPVAPVTAAAGSSTLSINVGTGTTVTFYAFTKTTAIGTVTVSQGGIAVTYYIQGTAGNVNTLAVSGSDIAPAGTQNSYVVTAMDVFGNKISGLALTATAANGALDTTTATTGSALTDFGTATFKVTLPASGATTVIFGLGAGVTAQTAIAGFATPTLAAAKVISVRDLLAELSVANATKAATESALAAEKAASANAKLASDAEIVSLKAEIVTLKADSVTTKLAADKSLADAKAEAEVAKKSADEQLNAIKKAYNKLARLWNKKNPKAKVALVK